MNGAWRYVLTVQARRDMRRLDLSVRQRIFVALDSYVAAERRPDVRKLRGKDNEWRLRVGDWRVRYRRDTEARIIVVLGVRHRREAYRA